MTSIISGILNSELKEILSDKMGSNVNNQARADLKDVFEPVARKWDVDIYPLDVEKVRPSESVRLKCQVPLCEYYDVCKVCPPHIPSVAEFKEALQDYTEAFLVVLQEDIQDINSYRNDFAAELKLAEAVSQLEYAAFEQGRYMALGLVVGGCKLCEQCTPTGEPCRHPYKPRPSPEGFGIDITQLAREAGVPVEWPPRKKVTFIGLVLV